MQVSESEPTLDHPSYEQWRVRQGLPPLPERRRDRQSTTFYLSPRAKENLALLAAKLGYSSASLFLEAMGSNLLTVTKRKTNE